MSSSDSSFSAQVVSPHVRPPGLERKQRTLFLLLLSSRGSRITARSGSSTARSRRGCSSGGRRAGAGVQEHVLDILALECLGEERGPDGLDVGNLRRGDQGLELVGLRGEYQSVSGKAQCVLKVL